MSSKTIGRASLTGTGVNQSFISTNGSPYRLAANTTYLYWTNGASNVVGRASLNGTGVNQSFVIVIKDAVSLAVDSHYLYWGELEGAIGRTNLDGSTSGINGALVPLHPGEPVSGLAVDAQHIYWSQANNVGRSNLDGTGIAQSFVTGGNQVTGVALDEGAFAVTTTALPIATAGAKYATRLQAFAGIAPYTWSLSSGRCRRGCRCLRPG